MSIDLWSRIEHDQNILESELGLGLEWWDAILADDIQYSLFPSDRRFAFNVVGPVDSIIEWLKAEPVTVTVEDLDWTIEGDGRPISRIHIRDKAPRTSRG